MFCDDPLGLDVVKFGPFDAEHPTCKRSNPFLMQAASYCARHLPLWVSGVLVLRLLPPSLGVRGSCSARSWFLILGS